MNTDNPDAGTATITPAEFYGKAAAPVEPTKAEPVVDTEEVTPPKDEGAESEQLDADDSEPALVLELDGKEYDLTEVRKWQKGHLMQSDYTRKTMALADERKAFEAERKTEREQLQQAKAEIAAMKDTLQVLTAEDEAINWAELKEYEPEKYIALKEKADKRKAELEKLKAIKPNDLSDPALIEAERKKLFDSNPGWLDDEGKPTETFHADSKLINDWTVAAGFDATEVAQMRAHHLTTVLKAAKYDQLQERGREIKDKREKVPVVLKPKAKKQESEDVDPLQIMYGSKAK
jgi:hypothetical protein